MIKIYLSFLFGLIAAVSTAQITFNGCHPLFDDQDFVFDSVGTDGTGRHIYETVPIDGQPCSGIGSCEFRIAWNAGISQWEFLADDGTGDFSAPFLIYANSASSTPYPPDLRTGIWVEQTATTSGACGGGLDHI